MEYPVLRLKEDRLNGEKGLRPKRLAKPAAIIESTQYQGKHAELLESKEQEKKDVQRGQVQK